MTVTKELVHVPRVPDVQDEAEPVQVTEADKAWMAGVIDLKGSVLRKNNQTRRTAQLVLYVRVKDERIALRLSAMTGTAPERHSKPMAEAFMRRGCAEHCEAPHVHVNDTSPYPWQMPPTTQWAVTGIAAAVVLANIAPYMCTYEDYAPVVAEIISNFAATGQGSGAVRKTLSRLSGRGWQVPPAVTVRLAWDEREG